MTERGRGWDLVRACPNCGWPSDDCRCSGPRRSPSVGPGIFRLRLEKRRGKPVTVAAGEGIDAMEMKPLLKELKGRLATGGTAKDGSLELQGDHRDRLRELLSQRGYRVKG